MASIINAATSGGLITTADTSGVLNIQTAGTTAISVSAAQVVDFANAPTVAGSSSTLLTNGGPLGTPSSGTLTNCTFPTLNQNTTGNAATATSATSATTATNLAGGSNGTVPYQTGSGATAMLAAGSSGQVLTSNGASAPSWTTISTSPPTTYGAVGTYVIAGLGGLGQNSNYGPDFTTAGSSLLYSINGQGAGVGLNSACTFSGYQPISGNNANGFFDGNLGLSGTWRALNRARSSSSGTGEALFLFVRVS